MKNYLLTITTLLITAISFGQTTFTVDDLDYEVLSTNPNTVEITGGTDVPADLEIPATVENSEGEIFSVVAIGTIAFKGEGLTSVFIPDTVITIDQEAFMNNNLTSVVIPASVTILETRAFNTNQISNLDLGEGLKTIGLSAFGRNSLSSIVIPANVTSIGTFAFFNNSISAVESQAIAPPSIQSNSFGDRSNISLTVPEGTEIAYEEGGWSGFQTVNDAPFIGLTFNTDEITYTVITLEPNEVTLSNGNNSTGNIEIPTTVSFNDFTYSVTAISNNAFRDNSLTSVVIPNTIASIGNTAFSGNAELLSVTSNNTTPPSLGNNVFIDTPTNKSLTIPDGTETAYETAGWTGFATVNGNVTIGTIFTVDGFTFAVTGSNPNTVQITDNSNTGVVTIPSSVDSSFGTFNITSIGNNAFRDNSLTSVVIPNTIASIGNTAFRDNLGLLSVTSNNSIAPSLGTDVFTNTPTDKSLTIPDGTETAYETAGWTGFATVNGNITIGTIFTADGFTFAVTGSNPNTVQITDNSNTGVVTIPSSIDSSFGTFNITSIGNNAFRDNSLTSIVIPNTIASIGNTAFSGNVELLSVTSNNSIAPSLGSDVFTNTPSEKTLSVPSGSEAEYETAGWSNNFFTVNGNATIGKQFSIDNINYEVIANNPNSVSVRGSSQAEINIPNTITISGLELLVTTISNSAFEDNTTINSISLGENIKTIEFEAFRDSSITEITSNALIPPVLEGSVFRGTGTKKLTIPAGTEAAYAEAGWTDFLIINDVFVVGKSFTVDNFNYTVTATTPTVAFTGGDGDDIVIPDSVTIFNEELSVTSIGAGVFRSGLGNRNTVTIGVNVLSIGDSAFRQSTFGQITSKSTTPPSLGSQVFVASTIGSIVVPVGTINAYAEAGWPASLLTEATTIELKLKTFLQGAYINPDTAEEDLRNDLQEASLIPLTSTYADERSAAHSFDTSQFFSPFILKVTDWIFVEIRDANEPSSVLDSRSLLLKTNGDIVDFTFDSEFTNPTFDQPLVDEYFVVIKHRNHISIRTANAISSDESFVNLDFTNNPTLIEGGENALVEVGDSIFAMIAGDFDENGQVQPSDVNETTAAIGTSAYSNADMDMNGQIQPADVNNLVNPNVGRGVQF